MHAVRNGIVIVLLTTAASWCALAPAAPLRIVSFSPALTEVLFAIGAGGRVTGVADFCTYPAEAATRVHVGGIANPNLELILTLKPDMVLLQGEMDLMRRFCTQHAIPMHAVELDTWATITNGIIVVGNLTACRSRAEMLVADMARRWTAVRARTATRPPVSTFICIGREAGPVASCMTATASSFLAEALTVAGGTNICADARGYYPTISTEVLTARQPRLIFDLRPGERIDAAHRARIEREWAPVYATSTNAIVVLTNDYLLIAGPRIVETAELFARQLHPREKP